MLLLLLLIRGDLKWRGDRKVGVWISSDKYGNVWGNGGIPVSPGDCSIYYWSNLFVYWERNPFLRSCLSRAKNIQKFWDSFKNLNLFYENSFIFNADAWWVHPTCVFLCVFCSVLHHASCIRVGGDWEMGQCHRHSILVQYSFFYYWWLQMIALHWFSLWLG